MTGWHFALLMFFQIAEQKTIEDFYADVLEITPIPTVEELNAGVWGEEFRAYLIDKADFEKVWKRKRQRK